MQLGAFYPFSRNHNFKGPIPQVRPTAAAISESNDKNFFFFFFQEPYRWDSVANISRKVLGIRYSLLPYYYTLLYKAYRPSSASSQPSATVVRPLFFEFPQDTTTYDMDWMFMVGGALLISPSLRVGKNSSWTNDIIS